MTVLRFLLCLFLFSSVSAWTTKHRRSQKGVDARMRRNYTVAACSTEDGGTDSQPSKSRRKFVQSMMGAIIGFSTSASFATARNLPLTTGADTSNTGTVSTLIPIVCLQQSLDNLQTELRNKKPQEITLPSMSIAPREEVSFKRILDAYSDPVSYKQKFVDQNAFLVYYSKGFDGPGRANIEDDLPVKQTLQYGSRNDAWVAWDDFLVEWDFALKDSEANNKEDLQQALQRTLKALDAYLSLTPTEDLQQANSTVIKAGGQ